MDIPKLHTELVENQTMLEARAAIFEEGRLPYKYYKTVCFIYDNYWQENPDALKFLVTEDEVVVTKDECTTFNLLFDNMRGVAAHTIQEYLIQHKGVVDAWPVWSAKCSYSIMGQKGEKYAFDYFGDTYEVTEKGEVRRKSDKFIYRNEYKFHGTPEYQKITDRKNELKSRLEVARHQYSLLYHVGGAALFGYMLLAIANIVADMAFGFGSILAKFFDAVQAATAGNFLGKAAQVVQFILMLPVYLHMLLKHFLGGRTAYWVAAVLLLGICAMLACFVWTYYKSYRPKAKEVRQAKRKYQELVGSQEYKRVLKENEEERKKQEAFAEEWHRAWYDWVCKHCEKPPRVKIKSVSPN